MGTITMFYASPKSDQGNIDAIGFHLLPFIIVISVDLPSTVN